MALKFYSSVRLDIRRIQAIKAAGDVIGNRTRVRVKKNKVAPPFRECEFDIMYDEGISKAGDVLDLGVELDLIEKRGSFYSYNGERLAQGRENAKQTMRENPALCLEIENAIRRETGLPELDLAPAFDFDTGAEVDEEVAEDEVLETQAALAVEATLID
jgi:recombination protein RecA